MRFFEQDQDGRYVAIQEEDIELADIGTVPQAGDIVVSLGVSQGLSRTPENRTVMEVQRRYFYGDGAPGEMVRIAIIVQCRRGMDNEIELLGD